MTQQNMEQIKARIAKLYQEREQLKQAMSDGQIKARQGFILLQELDSSLSELDSQFKQLWDQQQK